MLDRTLSPSTWVRLALSRSPESGVAVSTAGKILSREKRKMWMRFSQSAHILWYVCQARVSFARKKRNRNERQRSRNLLMRNLLTAFDANRNQEMGREIFLPSLQTFSTAGTQIFLDRRPTKTCLRKNFVLCTLPCSAPAKLFHRNRISFFRAARNCAARITRSHAGLITAILLLPFAVNCR